MTQKVRSLIDRLRAFLSPARQTQADSRTAPDDKDRLTRDESFYWGWCMNGHW
jgi:hypothetical protein